jgi:hypothetical protein
MSGDYRMEKNVEEAVVALPGQSGVCREGGRRT